ncbi:hypothetical protein [Ekhidna sp.]
MEFDIIPKRKSTIKTSSEEDKLAGKKAGESLLREATSILNPKSTKRFVWKYELSFYLGLIGLGSLVFMAFTTSDVATRKLFVSLAILLSISITKRFS